jgi:hypothetical protein
MVFEMKDFEMSFFSFIGFFDCFMGCFGIPFFIYIQSVFCEKLSIIL